MNHMLTILAIGTMAQCLAGCSKLAAPQERDQRSTVIAGLGSARVSVSGLQQNGATKGVLSANSFYTQVLEAGSNSAISGSSVAFPPGSLAIDTEIALATTAAIGNNETLQQLELGTQVSASGAPVAIGASTPMDALVPFSLSLPLPDGSGLRLTGDPYANLSVIYFVKKVGEGSASYTGVIPRAQIDISSGYAKISTLFFGTYQTIITQAPIEKSIEKPIEPVIKPAPAPQPAPALVGYFASQFMTTTNEPDFSGQRREGLLGMFTPMSPFEVGASARLTSSFLTYEIKNTE